jgi:putative membrane protein
MLQWLLAALHLLALGIGLGAVSLRALVLGGRLDADGLRRAFLADSLWGVAALLWLATGLYRAFGGMEKGTTYYLHNWVFALKMALLLLILVLEMRPMATLIRWRTQTGRGQTLDSAPAAALARTSWVQAALVILMVFAATAMARGYGAGAW